MDRPKRAPKRPRARPKAVLAFDLDPAILRCELAPHARVVRARNPRELERELADAEALLVLLTQTVDARLLDLAPRLRVVGNCAVGVNNIDLRECARRGIRVVNTPDVLTRATAELTLALLLAAARRIPEGEALCRSNRFDGWALDLLLGLELKGRQAVLVGPGRIGRETARLFRAIGLRVEWITRTDSERAVLEKLARAQILSLHVPLTPETRHWLDARRLRALPKDAIVLNTSRGPVIDEAALARGLRSGRLFAAGLDVYEREPQIPAALRRLPNVVLLPHLGSATRETRAAMMTLVARGVARVLVGKKARNQVVLPAAL